MKYFDMMNPLHFDKNVVENDGKIILFGANEKAKSFLEQSGKDFTIVGVVDTDSSKWGKIFTGQKVLSPAHLQELNAPVLIMEANYIEASELLNWLDIAPYFHWESIEIIRKNGSNNQEISPQEVNELIQNRKNDLSYDGWTEHTQYTHAMGVIDGIKFTNSLEAFHNTYEKGIRVFECDIAKDSTGVFYLCHGRGPLHNIFLCKGDGWRPLMKNVYNKLDEIGFPVSFEQFQKEKIYGKYTPLRLEELLTLMHDYPDISLIIDAKCDMESIFQAIEKLEKNIFKRIMLTCTIPALEQFSKAKGHENITAILLREGDMDADLPDRRSTHNELIRTCLRYGIQTVELNANRVNRGFTDLAAQYGIKICVPITNASSDAIQKKYSDMGVSIFEIRSI